MTKADIVVFRRWRDTGRHHRPLPRACLRTSSGDCCDAYERVGQHGGADLPRCHSTYDPVFAQRRCGTGRTSYGPSATHYDRSSGPIEDITKRDDNLQRTSAARCKSTITDWRKDHDGTPPHPSSTLAEFSWPRRGPRRLSRRMDRRPSSSSKAHRLAIGENSARRGPPGQRAGPRRWNSAPLGIQAQGWDQDLVYHRGCR